MHAMDREEAGGQTVDSSMSPSFAPLKDDTGLEIVDPIERRRFKLITGEEVEIEASSTGEHHFPVDKAVGIQTDLITLPHVVASYVRDADGEMLSECDDYMYEEFPQGEYTLELCAPMKIYLTVTSPLTVFASGDQLTFSFDESTDVSVGARSHHKQPAGTITTTHDPVDMMTAVSYLASSLKTTTCERSYPTLRGHPPTIELGDEMHIPEGISKPDTNIRIETPADYQSVFVVAPLAYYLGADVVPGSIPKIVTDSGFEYYLNTTQGFESEVERVLKQVFFLDCLTRTEGYYQVDLHERNETEELLDLDFETLYEAPISAQLEEYLSVPFELVEEHIPEWKLSTYIAPTPQNVETLPFVVNDLAVIRTPRATSVSTAEAQIAAIDEFMRAGDFTRSASQSRENSLQLIKPETTDSLEQAWIGDDAPLHASKVTTDAFKNKLARTPTEGQIEITVVCNDEEMNEERDIANEIYGSHEDLPFEVNVEHSVTMSELRDLLTSNTDFLHYVGHIDEDGFECTDGVFDARTLDSVSIDAFLLNACQSYEQGMSLIKAGSVGGIVTLSDVINSGAVEMGCNIARLLNRGFPLRATLNVARDESIVGGQYIVVGDGNVDISQAESGTPLFFEIESAEDGYALSMHTYPASDRDMGSLISPVMEKNNEHFLNSGKINEFHVSQPELEEFLLLENVPIRLDGDFAWSKNVF